MEEKAQDSCGPGAVSTAGSGGAPGPEAWSGLSLRGVSAGEEEYRHLAAIVNASRDAIWSWKSDGTIASWNEGAERLLQYSADEIIGQSVFTLIPPDRHERARAAIQEIESGNWYSRYETERVRKDGTRIPVELTVSPIHDQAGNIMAVATICRDITERKQAEAARQHLAAIFESSEDAIVAKDLDGIITSWNQGAERLFGYASGEVRGKPITIIIPPDRRHEETHILERIRRGEHVEPYDTVRQRKDGSLVDVSLTVSPVRDAAGRIVGASKIARDITERKQAEQMRQLLARELTHRVRNTLAVVQAMASLTFRDIPAASQALKDFRGRLTALAGAHDLLIREEWEQAPLSELVRTVTGPSGQSGRISVSGPPVTLEPRAAVTVSLALHELCTNALKYGALSTRTGKVDVSWSVGGGVTPRLTLSWQERGGPAVSPPTRRGFGVLMLEQLLAQHLDGGASLDFRPDGLLCTLDVPLARQG